MGYPWFFVFVSLVAKTLALGRNVIFVLLAGWFSYVSFMPFKLACLVFASSQVG